jgi:hypothetical protein
MTINFDFNSLKEKAKDLAQTSVAKAKELSDTAIGKGKELSEIGKLKVQNASEQETIKKAYLELGKLYFAERGAAPEAAYAALCEQITASKAKIDYNNERISDIKAAGNLSDEDIQDVAGECGAEEPAAPVEEAEAPAEEAPEAPAADENNAE